jgi:hypothetical protein
MFLENTACELFEGSARGKINSSVCAACKVAAERICGNYVCIIILIIKDENNNVPIESIIIKDGTHVKSCRDNRGSKGVQAGGLFFIL